MNIVKVQAAEDIIYLLPENYSNIFAKITDRFYSFVNISINEGEISIDNKKNSWEPFCNLIQAFNKIHLTENTTSKEFLEKEYNLTQINCDDNCSFLIPNNNIGYVGRIYMDQYCFFEIASFNDSTCIQIYHHNLVLLLNLITVINEMFMTLRNGDKLTKELVKIYND